MGMNMNERLTDRYGRNGEAIGYDKDGNAYVMRWSDLEDCWVGCGFDPKISRASAFAFRLRGEMRGFIVEHSQPTQSRS